MDTAIYLGIGAAAGLVMGMLGVGGGVLIITGLLLVAHFPQKLAQGTTLLIVAAPISLLAAYRYYKAGNVDIQAGLLIMAAFAVCTYLGAMLAVRIPAPYLRRALGVVLVAMGIKLVLS